MAAPDLSKPHCTRCGYLLPVDAWRCPSCAAPADEPARPNVDCLAPPAPVRLPPGVQLHSLDVLGAVVVGLLSVIGLLSLAFAVAEVKLAAYIRDGELTRRDDAQQLIDAGTVIQGVLFLAVVVGWFAWLVRARRNARAFGITAQRGSDLWAVLCWFVPVVQLFYPRRVMGDVWRGSGALRASVLSWWWSLVLAYWLVLLPVAALLGDGANDEPAKTTLHRVVAVGELVAAAYLLLAAFIAYRLTHLQQEAGRRATDDLPPLPAGSTPDPAGVGS